MEPFVYYALGTLIVAALVWIRTKQPATSIYDTFNQFQDALTIAPSVVAAVEQLWQTGAIPKDKRLDEAMRRLGEWFPALTEHQLRTIIEGTVWLLKQGTPPAGEAELWKTLQLGKRS